MKTIIIAGASTAILAAASAVAQPVPQSAAQPQTRASVQARVAEHFARADADRDGFVSHAEAQAMRSAVVKQRGHRVAAGAHANPGALFDRLDTNRDGAISRAEFDAMHAQRQQRRAARDANADGRPDARRTHGHGMAGLGGRMFAMADVNRDSRVSLQEATNAALQRFDRIDINRDGQITPDERRQARDRFRAQRQPG